MRHEDIWATSIAGRRKTKHKDSELELCLTRKVSVVGETGMRGREVREGSREDMMKGQGVLMVSGLQAIERTFTLTV